MCDVAELELSEVYNAGLALPGAFNTAASTIFGGSSAGTYSSNMDWAMKLEEEGINFQEMGVMDEEARITFRTAVAIMGTDEQQRLLDTQAVKVLKDEYLGLEVISNTSPDDLTREMYAHQNKKTAQKLWLEPLGRLVCRSHQFDDFNEYDLPKHRYPTGRLPKIQEGKQYEFWIEERVLEECFVGMKLDVRVLTLDSGITVLDDVREVMCSFYRWLPNELWMGRHPKEVVIRKKNVDEDQVDEDGIEECANDEYALDD